MWPHPIHNPYNLLSKNTLVNRFLHKLATIPVFIISPAIIDSKLTPECKKYHHIQGVEHTSLIDQNGKWFIITTKNKKDNVQIVIDNIIDNYFALLMTYSGVPDITQNKIPIKNSLRLTLISKKIQIFKIKRNPSFCEPL